MEGSGDYREIIREKFAEQIDKKLYKAMKQYARQKKEEEEGQQQSMVSSTEGDKHDSETKTDK